MVLKVDVWAVGLINVGAVVAVAAAVMFGTHVVGSDVAAYRDSIISGKYYLVFCCRKCSCYFLTHSTW